MLRSRVPGVACPTALTVSACLATPAFAVVVPEPVYDQAGDCTNALETIGSADTGVFEKSAEEIVAYTTRRRSACSP